MSTIPQIKFHSGQSETTGDMFSLSKPLASIHPDACPRHFVESDSAHQHYVAHRSEHAAPSTKTHHLIGPSGRVVGFIAFRIKEEVGRGCRRIFVSIEYAYIVQKFGRHDSRMQLLQPLIAEIEAVLRGDAGKNWRPKVYIHSATPPAEGSDLGISRMLDEELLELAESRRGVVLIGQRFDYPRGAAGERPWCDQMAGEKPPYPESAHAPLQGRD